MTEREHRFYSETELTGETAEESPRLAWTKPKPNEFVINGTTLPSVETHVGGFTPEELAAVSRARR